MDQEEKTAVTLATLRAMKRRGEKFACLTAYDASFAQVLESNGVEVLLVGDSLGMVVQGRSTTLAVTLDDMAYHTRCVARASRRALVMSDLPFMSDASPARALDSAARLMRAGAQVVKLEGGRVMADTVARLSERGLPVCAHIGLLPQSVHKLGGYRVQGRDAGAAARMREDAMLLEQAGADLLLLECVPAALAQEIVSSAGIPVIGIGAGASCDGQVLVLYDVIGISPGRRPRFSADFLAAGGGIAGAVGTYVRQVKSGEFPGRGHTFD